MKINDIVTEKGWTLFLDRDGVINRRLIDDYVKIPEEFDFLPGTLDAIAHFSKIFDKIFIVTNQQGIGKGLMSTKQLEAIHNTMLNQISENGGSIDAVYFCPHLKTENCNCRKPKTGMIIKAQSDFPDINLSKSIMIGDSLSDVELGINAGMKTIFVCTEHSQKAEKADFFINSLKDLI